MPSISRGGLSKRELTRKMAVQAMKNAMGGVKDDRKPTMQEYRRYKGLKDIEFDPEYGQKERRLMKKVKPMDMPKYKEKKAIY